MKKALFILTTLIISCASLFGQSAFISVVPVEGNIGTDTLLPGKEITFDIRFFCDYNCSFTEVSNGLKISSPDGATWSGLRVEPLCPEGYPCPFIVHYPYCCPPLGEDEDKICIGFTSLFDPWLTPWDGIPYRLKFTTALDYGCHIIIDTAATAECSWVWSSESCDPPLSDIYPDWGGPYEFVIGPSCCEGMRGDANGDGALDISDIVSLIDHLYLSHTPVICFEEADVNADGELDISDITCIISDLYIPKMFPCVQPCPGYIGPFGVLDTYTGCKGFEKSADTVTSADDCIMYEYDGQTLSLKHINAGFNCCVSSLGANITIEDNIITLEEYEIYPNCYCLCLYDLDYEIYNLPPGEYTIYVKELLIYGHEGREEIEFTVDLQPGVTGGYCVERLYYPWGY